MRDTPRSRPLGPPFNPGVRDLVEGKRRWASPVAPDAAQKGFRGWHERGYLPHRDEPALIQFVTFHLKDSFPRSLRSEWQFLASIENDRQRRDQVEIYLDKGRGECHLRRKEVARLVDDDLRQYASTQYELYAWVVMPNHVHVLFEPRDLPMSTIVAGWKKHTGRAANRLLTRRGSFWAPDYFDVFMRDAQHVERAIHYIENNPVKAQLVKDPKDWPWSSARFRNEYGVLNL